MQSRRGRHACCTFRSGRSRNSDARGPRRERVLGAGRPPVAVRPRHQAGSRRSGNLLVRSHGTAAANTRNGALPHRQPEMNMLGSSRRGFLGAVLGLAFLPWTYARELRGVTLPDEIKITDDGPVLQLAGAGVFRYFFISVYVCGLYLPPRQTWGNDPLGADHP